MTTMVIPSLDARDEAIRLAARLHYAKLSARGQAKAIEIDLARVAGIARPRPMDARSKRDVLQRIVDLGGRDVGWRQIRNILAGRRTPQIRGL